MLFTLLVCFFVTLAECVENQINLKAKDRVVVKLDPDQVVEAFRSVVSSDYLKKLAHELASKAAEQFIAQMKKKERNATDYPPRIREPAILALMAAPAESIKHDVIQEIERTSSKEQHLLHSNLDTNIMDMKQAMALLKAPSPDGDNLDQVSPDLSEDEDTKKKKGTQVIQVMKVNGKYYRRFLGFV